MPWSTHTTEYSAPQGHGDLDIAFEPTGPRRGFAEWDVDATDVVIADGLSIRVASLDAVIDSKRSAGRLKDERALPYLESLRDELGRGRDE